MSDNPDETKSEIHKEKPEQNQDPLMAGDSSHHHDKEQTSIQAEETRKLIKQPNIGNPVKSITPDFHKIHFSTAERIRNMFGNTASEQMRKHIDNSIWEQMRQIEQATRPFNMTQNTIGHLARSAIENPLSRFFDEQAARHRHMMELLRPRWDQTLFGTAFSGSLRAIESINSFHQAEFLQTQATIRQQLRDVARLFEALHPKLPTFDQLSEFWLRYPDRIKENLVALATAGWYLDSEMSITDIVNFKEDLEDSTFEQVNDELAQHFRSSLDRIEASLCRDHPTRAKFIKEAFEAHRDGKYTLSIPALFAQADGICLDLIGVQIFTGNGLSHFAKQIDPDTLERAYLEPLLRKTPIADSSRQRRAAIPQLNRHAVMHGECKDFPSESNGLKAISFIHFVSHVLGMAIDWKSE